MKKSIFTTAYVVVLILIILLAACAPIAPASQQPPDATIAPMPTAQTTTREAQVQSVDIQIMDTDPPQVNAVVRGSLSESCATLAPSQVTLAANVFEIKVPD